MPLETLKYTALVILGGCLMASSASAGPRSTDPVGDPDFPDPAIARASEQAIDVRPFEFSVRFGPTFGWYAGAGHLELDFGARLSDTVQLVPSARVAGGLGTDDRNYIEFGGDLGVRVSRPKKVAGVGHFGVGALYLGQMMESGGVSHVYAVPYGRLGGGLRLAGDGRFAWGIEGAARFGYAVHRNPGLVDVITGLASDRSSFYGNLDISLVLSF
jgi:hypothetical protein